MITDIYNLIYYINGDIKNLKDKINQRIWILEQLAKDKYNLKYLYENYDELDNMIIIEQITKICNLLKYPKKEINKNFIQELIDIVDYRINETNKGIERLRYHIADKQSIINLFDPETKQLKTNITSVDQYQKIVDFVQKNKNIDLLQKNLILQELIIQDLNALKMRDKLNNKRANIEQLKTTITKKLREGKKKQIETKPVKEKEVLIPELTDKQKRIIINAENIIKLHNNTIKEGFNEEIEEAYSLSIEFNEIYIEALSKNFDKLMLCIKFIYEYLNNFKENKNIDIINKIDYYINEYNIYKQEQKQIDLENKKIEDFEQENSDKFESIRRACKTFEKFIDSLTEQEKNILNSIREYLDKEEYESIDGACYGSRINLSFYNELLLLKNISDFYDNYKSTDKYESKTEIFNNIEETLEQYTDLISNKALISDDSNTKSNVKQDSNNILIYLTLPDKNITCIEDFCNQCKTEISSGTNKIERAINLLSNKDRNQIFTISESVKKKGANTKSLDDKVRRMRISDIRLLFADINAFGNMNINLEKDCYIVITGGPKLGNTDIYEYVNSQAMRDLILDFYNLIKNEIDNIKKQNISEKEKDEKINKFINDLSEKSKKKYTSFIDNSKKIKPENDEKDKEVTPNEK